MKVTRRKVSARLILTALVLSLVPINVSAGDPSAPLAQALVSGVEQAGQITSQGGQQSYTIAVPAGSKALKVFLAGQAGIDVDLYARRSLQPTTSRSDASSADAGPVEALSIASPRAGTYHLMVRAREGQGDYTIVAVVCRTSGPTCIESGEQVQGTVGAGRSSQAYRFLVSPGVPSLRLVFDGVQGRRYDLQINGKSKRIEGDDRLLLHLPPSGLYALEVSSSAVQSAGYELTLELETSGSQAASSCNALVEPCVALLPPIQAGPGLGTPGGSSPYSLRFPSGPGRLEIPAVVGGAGETITAIYREATPRGKIRLILYGPARPDTSDPYGPYAMSSGTGSATLSYRISQQDALRDGRWTVTVENTSGRSRQGLFGISKDTATTSFQYGRLPTTSYRGMQDTVLSEAAPTTNRGRARTCLADGDDPQGTGQDLASLLRWNVSAISRGSLVTRASITLNLTDPTVGTYWLYEMKRPWVEGQATWRNYRDNRRWEVAGAWGSSDRGSPILGSLRGQGTGQAVISLNSAGLALVESWIDNPNSNRGLILVPDSNTTDGIDFHCSESTDPAKRPMLSVTYRRTQDHRAISFQYRRLPRSDYSAMQDTVLSQDSPNGNLGSARTCLADGDDPPGTGLGLATLLRWGVQAIPAGSLITKATVTLNVTDPTVGTYHLYEMKRIWVDSEATWRSYRSGFRWATAGAEGSSDRGSTILGSLSAQAEGEAVIALNNAGLALVESWISSAPNSNRGLILVAGDDTSDGLDFDCRETTVASNRPKFTVEYEAP